MTTSTAAGPTPLDGLTVADLRRRTSAKWRAFPPDVLPLWVAEMDVTLAEPVERALLDAVRAGDTGYSVGRPYREALAGFAAARWGWDDLDVGRASLAADVMVGVTEALALMTDPGDTVVVASPVYPPFFASPGHAGRRVLPVALGADDRLDLDALAEGFTRARAGGGRAAFLLCNPHNPTGVVHTRVELEAVAALAHEHGVGVVADEIHAALVLDGAGFTPYLTVDPAGLAVHSASKAWNLAGAKAAVVVAGPQAPGEVPEIVSHGPSHLGVLAHTAAFTDGGPWLDALLRGLDARRTLLAELLAEHLPEVRWSRPEGTFLAWLDCRVLDLPGMVPDTGGDPGDVTSRSGPAAWFTEHARVALSSGAAFGPGGEGFARLNYATTVEVLTAAVTAMGEAVRAPSGR